MPKTIVNVIDTTWAGDIFGGSAMWKLLGYRKTIDELARDELMDIATFACTAATLSTSRAGGISSIFSYNEIMNATTFRLH